MVGLPTIQGSPTKSARVAGAAPLGDRERLAQLDHARAEHRAGQSFLGVQAFCANYAIWSELGTGLIGQECRPI